MVAVAGVTSCGACGSAALRRHCDGQARRGTNPLCDWWVCTRCSSYGSKDRTVDMRGTR